MSGAVPPSAQFSVRGIAEALGVGLTPTRVALKGLETEGILRSSPRRNFLINVPSIENFNEILFIRLKLESAAAVAAIENLTDADVEEIGHICESMEDRSDPFDGLRLNFDFHFSIYRRSEMGFLVSLIEIAWLRVGPLFHLLGADFNRGGEGGRNHRRIVASLRARDRNAVRVAVQTDLVDGAEPIREKLRLISP